ncbi:MAG TPA: GtrA family protein [Gaiellaceae bacterium]|jgi:dolichol-phosphate mannosyltransferase|nr:GtrA family protein [Gaiellaceae bacterium]
MAKGAEATSSRANVLTGAASSALRRPGNWFQLAKFCTVGASGYVVNLAVYGSLLALDVHYLPAAVCSFLVAVTNNYVWNRVWTFRHQRGHLVFQGVRFLVVSTIALAANLTFLSALVALGVGELPAQAIAIVLVTPWNFVANKLWSFRRRPRSS